jgi:hypothetical protein
MWPGTQAGLVGTQFEATYYDPMKKYGGAWDVFRLVDSTRIGTTDAQQRVILNIKDTYHHAHVTIDPATASTSPLASSTWRQFRCGS